jgi:hypothetical protein
VVNSENDKEPNAVRDHAIALYDAMLKVAETNEHDEIVYVGMYSKLCDSLGISRVYYSRIRTVLTKMGCIEFVSRGSGKHGSRILLLRKPVEEDFTNLTLTERRETARVVSELERRIAAVEAWRHAQTGGGTLNLAEALRDHERRISQVEQERADAKAAKDE